VEPRTILQHRVRSLEADLESAVRGLEKTRDPGLKLRLKPCFDELVHDLRERLKDVGTRVAAGDSVASCWQKFHKVDGECVDFFGECLAFSLGDIVRAPEAGLDGGLCAVADVLLDELSRKSNVRWRRLTVVSEREYYQDLAQIIRLRYPATTVWDLPVAAHEFGHFAGPNYQTEDKPPRFPFGDYLSKEVEKAVKDGELPKQAENHIQEYFADLFAVWALGPAYGCTCILGRFDPSQDPFAGSYTHPGDGHRAHAVLWALEQMDAENKRSFKPSFNDSIVRLRDHWQACLAAANPLESVITKKERELRDRRIKELWAVVTTHFRPVRYDSWGRAANLAGRTMQVTTKNLLAAGSSKGDVLRDVLNAASRMRLTTEGEDAWRAISARALELCREVAAAG